MAFINSTSIGHLPKYNDGLKHIIEQSMYHSVPINNSRYTDTIIKLCDKNIETLNQYLNLSFTDEKQSKHLQLLTDQNKTIKFLNIEKPHFNINMGDVAEGIVSCGFVAKFLKQGKTINHDDIVNVITQLGNLNDDISINKVFQNVHLYLTLPKPSFIYLLTNYKSLSSQKLIDKAVIFLNSRFLSHKLSNPTVQYKNSVFYVFGEGPKDTHLSKTDIRIEIKDSETHNLLNDIHISLKAGKVKTFGQVGGSNFDKQVKLWGSFGITLDDSSNDLYQIYNKCGDIISSDMYDINKFVDGIVLHATKNDPKLVFLQLDNDVWVYDFYSLYDQLQNKKITYNITTIKNSNIPVIRFFIDDQPFLTIRIKRNGLYLRNTIEKEYYMTQLIAQKL